MSKSGIEIKIVALKREEWDRVRRVGYKVELTKSRISRIMISLCSTAPEPQIAMRMGHRIRLRRRAVIEVELIRSVVSLVTVPNRLTAALMFWER